MKVFSVYSLILLIDFIQKFLVGFGIWLEFNNEYQDKSLELMRYLKENVVIEVFVILFINLCLLEFFIIVREEKWRSFKK